jgi:hypothetical protein
LETKFHALTDALLGADQSQALINACWTTSQTANVRDIVALTRPAISQASPS